MEIMSDDGKDLKDFRGLVATVDLTGSVQQETSQSLLQLGMHNASQGFTNIEYRTFPAQLVEAGRDHVCKHALNPKGDGSERPYDWILMFDGDAIFSPDSLIRLLKTAYVEHPEADVVGAYAQLKGNLYLPCIDTGSGTWEPHFPNSGVLPVIRTGGHFLLVKTRILRAFGPPWFRTRLTKRPVDALAEVDNYARIKLNGQNPLQETDAWQELTKQAYSEAHRQFEASVGEDSGFCDRVTSVGGKIYVDTRVTTGHITKKIISAKDLKDKLEERCRHQRLAVGVYE